VTTERLTNGGPSSWQSKAAVSACLVGYQLGSRFRGMKLP
jgi:hypothetical protein